MVRDLPNSVKLPVGLVLNSYYLSRVTGDYWEDSLIKQYNNIKELPSRIRIVFFQKILITTCDIDTSRALIFVELLGKDASELRRSLIKLKSTHDFSLLNNLQKKIVIDWIEDLNIVESLNHQSSGGSFDKMVE